MEAKLRELDIKKAIGIGIALAVAYYFFVYNAPDIKNTVAAKRAEIEALEAEVKKLDEQILASDQDKIDLVKVKEEIKGRAKRFKIGLPPERIQQIISEEARAAGIFFDSISSDTGSEQNYVAVDPNAPVVFSVEEYISKFGITTSFNGNFPQVMRFLSYLTRTDDIISLRNLKIASEMSGEFNANKSPTLKFDANFEAYSLNKDITVEKLNTEPPPVEDPNAAPQEGI